MQAFFINVFIAVLTSDKVQALLRTLMGEATDDIKKHISDEIDGVEAAILRIPQEILGDATKDVGILLREITGTTDDIAGAVKGQVSPLLPTADSLQNMFVNVLKNLPGGGILGGILGR